MSVDYERFEDYLYSLEDNTPSYLKELEERALEERVPIIRKSAQSILRFLLQLKSPKRILEIGTATGFSALFMAEFVDDSAEIITVEKFKERVEKAALNFKSYDRNQKITLIDGDALEVLSELSEKEGDTFDFIFLDASKGQYLAFLPYLKILLKKGGILVTDNLLQEGRLLDSNYTVIRRERTIHKRMREYVKTLYGSEDFETMLLQDGDGMSVSIKK